MSRIDSFEPNMCCGCMACAEICPQEAIYMHEDEKGFLVPIIDDAKCVNCGLCLNVCDFKKTPQTESNIEKAYSLVINDQDILKKSTSGGAFTALSDVVLERSGYVVGSIMENDFTIRHVITIDKNERDKMRGSKYVQSNTLGIWKSIRELLSQGKVVLFTGTPCQCAALKSFLGKEYDNLIVVDFLCHGVPNNRMFKEHIKYLNSYYKAESVGYSFRDKTFGWDGYNNVLKLANGKRKTQWINQIFYSFFVSNLSLRLSCHQCPYRSYYRPSDITIADFWGIEKLTGHTNRDGVSLVLVHSKKGLNVLNQAQEKCQVREYPTESVLFRIQTAPSKANLNCEVFWKTYIEDGYNGVANKFFNNSFKNKVRFEVRKIAKTLRVR